MEKISARESGARFSYGASLAVLGTLALLTWQQTTLWKDSYRLWSEAHARGAGGMAKAHANLGEVYLSRGEWGPAEKELRRAVAIDETLADAWNGLGVCAMYRGETPLAIRLFRKAIELRPNDAESMSNLAHALSSINEPQEALPWIERALAHDAQSPRYYENRARILTKLHRTEEAIRDWTAVVRLASDDAVARAELAALQPR